MKKIVSAFIFYCLVITPAFSTDVGIGIFLQAQAYFQEESVNFYISGYNLEADSETVDVHVVIVAADNTIYEYPDWNTSLTPWLPSFSIPGNYQLPVTLLDNLDSFPGGLIPGEVYRIAVVLTKPGTLDFLSLNILPFKTVSGKDSQIIGSTYLTQNIQDFLGEASSNSNPVLTGAGFYRQIEPRLAEDEIPSTNIEQCLFKLEVGHESGPSVDAGPSIVLDSASEGKYKLPQLKYSEYIFYGDTNNPAPESFYRVGEYYTAFSTGSSEMNPFSVIVDAPETVVVTEPNLSTFSNIDSSQDLLLRWEGNNGVGEINVMLVGNRATPGEIVFIHCRFADDGEAIIPSNLLVQLRDSNANGYQLQMNFSRANFNFLNNNDEDRTNFRVSSITGKPYLDIK